MSTLSGGGSGRGGLGGGVAVSAPVGSSSSERGTPSLIGGHASGSGLVGATSGAAAALLTAAADDKKESLARPVTAAWSLPRRSFMETLVR
jgi:hypothetical protein